MIDLLKTRRLTSLLGLALDGDRLNGVWLKRTNGSVEIRSVFTVQLSLDPLTDDPELLGREIRKQLDDAGIRQRRCTVALPIDWMLTLQVKLPELPEADLESLLQLEAERGMPYPPESLLMSRSRFRTPDGESFATLVAVPREHVTRLEAALRAAQLQPVSFSLGIAALQPGRSDASEATLTLLAGHHRIALQVNCAGGTVALRSIETHLDAEESEIPQQLDQLARELRITLGQLPASVRSRLHVLQLVGSDEIAELLAEDLAPRLESLGLRLERVREQSAPVENVRLPARTPVSPALALALHHLLGSPVEFEFLPPRISAWQRLTKRYSSGKLVWTSAAAGAVILLAAGAFAFQEWRFSHWNAQWQTMRPSVTELDVMQQKIRQFRPWFDNSFRSLAILQSLTEAFPEDGAVTAKSVEIREPALVTCTGTARDHQNLLQMLDRLRATRLVADINVDQMRGESPMQFTFNFSWGTPSSHE
jgi:hypothetical protein